MTEITPGRDVAVKPGNSGAPVTVSEAVRHRVAWLMWCLDHGYVNAEDRSILTSWLEEDPAALHPADAARRPHLLAMADEVIAAANDEARADLAKAGELIGSLERITTAWSRGMYAARVDCWRGDPKAAAAILSEGLDGFDGTEWDGNETGTEWWERTKAEEGL